MYFICLVLIHFWCYPATLTGTGIKGAVAMGRRGTGTTGLLLAASPSPSPPSPSPAPRLPRPRAVSLAARSSFGGAGAAVDEKKRVARMRSKLLGFILTQQQPTWLS